MSATWRDQIGDWRYNVGVNLTTIKNKVKRVDLQINTYLKEDIAKIMFGKDTISHKRIAIRKLKKKGLSREYVKLFLRILEYISEF